ncbi:venom phosphodiesterase-like [Penaeus japonicus]|uniref:venom phosphodiesterase-like n=1 Tax=Penaeus japonicus TaxID=27405 RepID=UPI001C70F22F|nr:venom phosphodiesterase-like [Penaeus japonicus]
MKRSQGYVIIGGIVVVLVVVVLMAVLIPPKPVISTCPASYQSHPLILVSLDGFRADYLERGLTPGLQALVDEGVHAPYMKPSYPTLTFPNHYSIVTGLYPESHGIIANSFYDPEFGASFSLGSAESLKGRWWGGEPIWNTLTRQGKSSATFFWPGSDADIGGQHPTYWIPYNDDTPFSERIQQVLSWIDLQENERPAWISLYLNEPDHTGHGEGPNSNQVDALIMYADFMIQQLVSGLEARGLDSCVNMVVLADHGMAASGADKIIKLKDYVPDIYDLAYTYSGAFGRISLKNESEEVEMDILEKLSCQREELRAYDYRDLPTRFHFSHNRRIEDIVLDLDPGFTVTTSSDFYLEGQHGYDNYFQKMNALFIGRGPAFKKGVEIEPFQNIELYNLMCYLTGVTPAPNNGTEGSLYHALVSPPDAPSLPEEAKPPTAPYPGPGEVEARLSLSGCAGDLVAIEWKYPKAELRLGAGALAGPVERVRHHSHDCCSIYDARTLCLATACLFPTGFSESLKMPLWTSVTVSDTRTEAQPPLWCSDVRLTALTSPTCAEYEALNMTMAPLLPPSFVQDPELVRVPYMVSNSVPAAPQLAERWSQLVTDLVPAWLGGRDSLNLVVGPVFDSDADSHVDNFTMFSPPPETPSDMFAVITRCESPSVPVDDCAPEELDAVAFIVPESIRVPNCMNATRFAQEFSAKVRDVEIATGLTFYPGLSFADRARLGLRIHSDIWPLA